MSLTAYRCKYPIIHPGLFQTPDTPFPPGLLRETAYKGVITDGTRGVTGNDDHVLTIGDRTQNIFQEIDLSSCNEQDIDAIVKGVSPVKNYNKALSLAYASHKWAGRFAQKFIEVFWNPDQYETAWFCNPPHLRTVPGEYIDCNLPSLRQECFRSKSFSVREDC